MAAVADWMAGVFAPWVDFYADSSSAETLVMFLHLGAMVAAGGLAFTLDRAILRARAGGEARQSDLAREIHDSHRAVIGGLMVVILSGLALTASDPAVFLVSWIYWAKIAAVALLLLNGLFLKRAGERLLAEPKDEAAWRSLRTSAVRSAALWALAILSGVAITVYA